MSRRTPIVALILTLNSLVAFAETSVTCTAGCQSRTACDGDSSPNLLCLVDRASDVTLSWQIDHALGKNESIKVYAGNPLAASSIPERQVTFTQQDQTLRGSYTLRGDQLGKGPLLVVTTLAKGNDESLLAWIPFRTATPDETRARLAGPRAASEWAVDIVPSFMQVSSGTRDLPRTQDTTMTTWFSLAGMELPIADADLDGPSTGAPGLGIQAAQPWHAREDWREEILQRLQLPSKHSVSVEELKWDEMPDRTADFQGVGTVSLRNFYTVVTLFTNATVSNYSDHDLGHSGSGRYFAHETGARLKTPDHPLLWASYNPSDYGSDLKLLELLRRHVATQSTGVLGLGPILSASGDGGAPVYRVGFTVRARPWEDETTRDMKSRIAGIVGIDIAAVRSGIGEVLIPADKDTKGVSPDGDCGVWKCPPGNTAAINPNDPPRHMDIESWQVSVATPPGQAPLIREIGSIAQRNVETASAANPASKSLPDRFPADARFAVGANLRAGAVLRRGGIFDYRVDGVVPINVYAQFVVRIAVVTFPGTELPATDTPIVTSPKDLRIEIAPPQRGRFSKLFHDWVRDHFGLSIGLLAFLIVLAIFAVCVIIPGCVLVGAVLQFFTAVIRRITQLIRPR